MSVTPPVACNNNISVRRGDAGADPNSARNKTTGSRVIIPSWMHESACKNLKTLLPEWFKYVQHEQSRSTLERESPPMHDVSAQLGHSAVRLLTGDITKIPADAIVNAANSRLLGGGGVDGAIHRAGGPSIMRELNRLRPAGGCPPGQVVATQAGNLPAKFVFHAVGPIWQGGGQGEAEQLACCYRTCLGMAEEHDTRVISFPSISTGAYGYPLEQAAQVALEAVFGHLRNAPKTILEQVLFVLFDERTFDAYASELSVLREPGQTQSL